MTKYKLTETITGIEKRVYEIEAENEEEAKDKFKQTNNGWNQIKGVIHKSSRDLGESVDIEVKKIDG